MGRIVSQSGSAVVVSDNFPNSRDVIQPLYFDNGMAAPPYR
jgi:hypothetical protein